MKQNHPQQQGSLHRWWSQELLMKALKSLDRAAIAMITAAWLGALCMMGLALYTVTKAHQTQQKTETAAALEPAVPIIQKSIMPRPELEKLAVRLRGRYEKLIFNALPENALEIASSEPNSFQDWLASLSYLDTIAPQARWSIKDFCVGTECGGSALMRAVVSGERINFKIPEPQSFDEVPPPAAADKKS
jgi:hypothetical protein